MSVQDHAEHAERTERRVNPNRAFGPLPPSAYGEDESTPSPIGPSADTAAAFTTDTDTDIRCGKCSKLLAEFATRPYQVRCPRCKTVKGAQPRLSA